MFPPTKSRRRDPPSTGTAGTAERAANVWAQVAAAQVETGRLKRELDAAAARHEVEMARLEREARAEMAPMQRAVSTAEAKHSELTRRAAELQVQANHEANDSAATGLLSLDWHLLASIAALLVVRELGALASVCQRFGRPPAVAAAGELSAPVRCSVVEEAARLAVGAMPQGDQWPRAPGQAWLRLLADMVCGVSSWQRSSARCHEMLAWDAAGVVLTKALGRHSPVSCVAGGWGGGGRRAWAVRVWRCTGGMCLGVAEPGLALGGRVTDAGRHAAVTSTGGAYQTGRPDVFGLPRFDAAGQTLDFELDPAAGTLTVRLDGAPHHVFTGLGGEAWCPVITLLYVGDVVEVLPFSPSGAYPAVLHAPWFCPDYFVRWTTYMNDR
jgi:hypothetical protein